MYVPLEKTDDTNNAFLAKYVNNLNDSLIARLITVQLP